MVVKAVKKPVVGIVGLGYVGLPTAITAAQKGFRVFGVDINQKRVNQLNQGQSYVADIPNSAIREVQKKFTATTDWRVLKKCQVIIISVPTPLTEFKTPDTSFIENASQKVSEYLSPKTLVILESTTYPGTTEELVKPILEGFGLKAGRDFFLAFAPERVDPGNRQFGIGNVPKVVGGIDQKSTDLAVKFYSQVVKQVVPVSSCAAAEMTKLLENIFRLVNISMVNELKMLSDKMGVDFWEVIEAAKTKPYGFMAFHPGPGCGGHCIPLDPFYLSWKARQYNFFTRFIDLAGEINELMPSYTVTKIASALNRKRRALHGAKILILGVAYKKDIDDPRESPSIEVMKQLMHKRAIVTYNDPHVHEIEIKGEKIYSMPLTDSFLKKMDCVVILTDHSSYDWGFITKNAKLVVDTRNAIKGSHKKVVK